MADVRVLERVTKNLRCVLTDPEVLERGEKIAGLMAEEDKLEGEREAMSKRLKGEVADLAEQRSYLGREVRERATHRDVDCEVQLDVRAKRVETIRLDTGEPVPGTARAATAKELQGNLFDAKAGA